MSDESRRIPPISDWQGLGVGVVVVIVFIISLIDWVFGMTFIPINLLVALSTFTALALISGVLLVLASKALSLRGLIGRSELVTTGVYARIRHPHYLSDVLLSFSAAMLFRSWMGLFTAFCSVPVTYALTLSEEHHLKTKFGNSYAEYASEVPMFIPKIRRKR